MRVLSKICLAIIVLVLVGASKPASADRGPNNVKVLYPNGGETLVIGKRYTLKWTPCSTLGTGKVSITVSNDDAKTVWWNDRKSGANFFSIQRDDTGSYRWKVPTSFKPGTEYRVEVSWYYRCKKSDLTPQYDSDGVPLPGQKVVSPSDKSNKPFTIAKKGSTPTAGTLKVTSPSGGQKWQKGKSYVIKWSKGNGGTYVDVYLYKAGKYYRTIKSKAKNRGRLRWRIPKSLQNGSQYKVRVQAYSDSDIYDDSNNNFTISNTSSAATNSLKVTSPNGGEKWEAGPARTIKWQKGNGGTYVDIYLYKSGRFNRTIKSKAKNSGRHRWVIPTSVKFGTQYKIRVQSYTDSDIYDESDRNFTVN